MIGRRRKLSCRQVGKSLQEFLDNEITDSDHGARLQAHLEACRECGLEAETYRALQQVIRQRGSYPTSPELERLRDFGARLAAGEIDIAD